MIDKEVVARAIFCGETTQKNDYRPPPNKLYARSADEFVTQREKPDLSYTRQKPLVPIDFESFAPLKKKVSFNVFINLVSIPHYNPNDDKIPLDFMENEEELQQEAIKTRPRVYNLPQICFDDISDPVKRKILIDNMYTTEFKSAEKEVNRLRPVTKPVPDYKTDCKGFFGVQYKPPLMEAMKPEWNKNGMKWTNQQLVGVPENTRHFWENMDIKCGACVNPLKNLVPPEKKREIKQLIQSNTIRRAHDVTPLSYCGFKPQLAAGVGLKQKTLSCSHPFMSMNQIVQKRREL